MATALITGPTSGIGGAFARALAREGYDLVLVARDVSRLSRLGQELSAQHGIRCDVLVADLARIDETARVEDRLRTGGIDLLVNNAGFGLGAPFDETDVAEEQQNLDVLVRAVMRLCHAALGPMLAAGHGEILNVSSVAGYLPRGSYGANKAWVTAFSAWAGVKYRDRGVRVMALCPGFVRTEFHERMDVEMRGTPSWMWLRADDVVRTALSDLRRGKVVSIPSRRYKLIVTVSRIAPRRLVERVSRRGRR